MDKRQEISAVDALELRISPHWALLLFGLFGLITLLISDNFSDSVRRNAFIQQFQI